MTPSAGGPPVARTGRARAPVDRRALQRGIGLVEWLMVVALVGVLVALALPGAASRLQRERLAHAAETLAGDLREARFEAARRQQRVQVSAASGPGWCWAVATATGCRCQPAATADALPACMLHQVDARHHPGVQLVRGGTVALGADGTAAGGVVAVLATPRGDTLRVELATLGRPRICAEGPGFWRYPVC